MKRFISVFLLMSGLLVAGGAKAVGLGNSNFDCLNGPPGAPANIVGNIGDTYTVTNSGPPAFGLPYACTGPSYTVAGVVTNNPATLQQVGFIPPGVITFTLAAGGTTQVTLTNQAQRQSIVLTFTVNAPTPTPSPAPIPTLSEWAKITMMFLMIVTVGWYGRRLKQR